MKKPKFLTCKIALAFVLYVRPTELLHVRALTIRLAFAYRLLTLYVGKIETLHQGYPPRHFFS